ncbi:hypothetical protein CDAR_408631 [Caerostris darwini]|uniref:Uncharacterized protein n=1 Tax=Caerostris darwini TaxID=1538125 RepID=A0AAV4MHS5_9ARAC|nr:hypothetical protein CDAR_408631 [Caerostris darwini]
MACKSGFDRKPMQEISLQSLKLRDLDIVYVFVLGDPGTGKTTLIDYIMTRRISDHLLPSFQYVSESDRMTDIGMVTLRLLELNREQLYLPEISQVCRAEKHVFLFVYAFDDCSSFSFLYMTWILNVRKVFGRTVNTFMLGNKLDLKTDHYFKIKNPNYSDALSLTYKNIFNVDWASECCALTGYQVDSVFCEIAKLGIETRTFLIRRTF